MTDKKMDKTTLTIIVIVIFVIAIAIFIWFSQRKEAKGNGNGNGGDNGEVNGEVDLINVGTWDYISITPKPGYPGALDLQLWDQQFQRIGTDVETEDTIRDRLQRMHIHGSINQVQYDNGIAQLDNLGL